MILLFAFEHYEAEGGANDLRCSFASINGATVTALEMAEQYLTTDPTCAQWDRAHAFDLDVHRIVARWEKFDPVEHAGLRYGKQTGDAIGELDDRGEQWHRVTR